MNRLVSFATAVATAFVILTWSLCAQAAPAARETLLYAHCPKDAGEYVGTLKGRVRLERAFLDPAIYEADSIRAAVDHQIKYMWGYYHNEPELRRSYRMVLSSEPFDLEVKSRREVPYGRDLSLAWNPGPDPQLKIEDAYTARAVARGFTHKNDPALEIEYVARIKLAVCGRTADPQATLSGPLPADPWLAYWYLDKANHRPLTYFDSRAITNPCADDDFSDLPHPIYYWYDWLPSRHGPDADGHAFDCRAWLKAGVDFDEFSVVLERTGHAQGNFVGLRKALLADGEKAPIRATVLFGQIDHAVANLELGKWRDRIGDGATPELFAAHAHAAHQAWSRDNVREHGTGMFLKTLDAIDPIMKVEKFSSMVEDGYLVVVATGELRRSKQPIRLRAIFGITDVLGPKPPAHWRYLQKALTEDQIVVYWGHSGVGENFRLEQIEKHLAIPHERFARELTKSPVRLLAFISCYSYMYFGRDLLRAAAERLAGGVFVFTGTGPTSNNDGPLPVLDLIDRVLAPKNSNGHIDRLSHLSDDEFWIIKEVSEVGSK